MRLSEWRSRAPHKEAMTPKVLAVVGSVMATLGADDDPMCWIVWGDDPGVRYVVLAPTDAGLVQVLARVNVPGEGPRASAKVIRWNRVQLGELALEMVSGHRLLGFQVESHVLRGTDDEGDAMATFALELFARVDGRPFSPRATGRGRSDTARSATRSGSARRGTADREDASPGAARPSAAKPKTPKPGATKPAARTPAAGATAAVSRRTSP